MLAISLGWLAVLAPALSEASPVAIPEDKPALEKRGNLGSYGNYFPDCTNDPSYAPGTSAFQDGEGVYVASSCDNGLTTPAVVRFHCWYYTCNLQKAESQLTCRHIQDRPVRCEFTGYVLNLAELRFVESNRHS